MAHLNENEFKNRLYYGIAFEYYAIAEFYYLGFEAQKITADFGYDIIATNLKRVMDNGEEPIIMYFQIKARRAWKKQRKDKVGIETFIDIKEGHFNDFIKQDGRERYLKVYVSTQEDMLVRSFWLSHIQILDLFENNLFVKTVDRNKNNVFRLTLFLCQTGIDNKWTLYLENAGNLLSVDDRLLSLENIIEFKNTHLMVNQHFSTVHLQVFEQYFQLAFQEK